jgi:hypothetical protein
MNRGNLIRFSLAAALFLASGAARAQNALEIISLRHRTAEQVLPALQPLVEPGGMLAGQGNQLFVRTSPANFAELRRALDAIDRPARRLQVSVRFEDSRDASRRSVGASGRIGSGGSNVEIRARDSSSGAEARVDQRLQVLDGSHATIYLGASRPVRERRIIQTPAGPVPQDVIVEQDSRLGFDIVPRVSGSTVQVDVAGANGYTTASGTLGQWFELGALAGSRTRMESGIGSLSGSAASESNRVWIKVEALP